MPIASVLHVDEVENDDPAEIAKADLTGDLINRFHIGAGDRVLESGVTLANKFACINIDRDEGFGLVEDEIAARFQPYAGFESLIDLLLHAVIFQDRLVTRVELYAVDRPRLNKVYEFDRA